MKPRQDRLGRGRLRPCNVVFAEGAKCPTLTPAVVQFAARTKLHFFEKVPNGKAGYGSNAEAAKVLADGLKYAHKSGEAL